MPESVRSTTDVAEPILANLPRDLKIWTTPGRFELFSEIEFIHAEIFDSRCYLRHGGENLPDAPVILDIGANVGLFGLFMAKERPGASIVAFEPMPDTLAALRRNIETHGLDGVEVIPLALGSEPEEAVPFTFYPLLPGNSTRYPQDKAIGAQWSIDQIGAAAHERAMEARTVPVDVRRLSDVLASIGSTGPIDFVKIDVEGAELAVLGGIEERDWARIDRFVIEVQDLDGRLEALTALLQTHGFATVAEPQGDLPENFRYYMVFASRGNDIESGFARGSES